MSYHGRMPTHAYKLSDRRPTADETAMRRLARFTYHFARHAMLALAATLSTAALAIAAPKKGATEPPKEPAYALEYAVVIFAILITLALVYRPSKRTDLVDELKLPFGPKR
jgi:hypothetical protein